VVRDVMRGQMRRGFFPVESKIGKDNVTVKSDDK
jgi:hypothetical protein